MQGILKLLACGIALAGCAAAQADAPVQDFTAQSLAGIEQQRRGEAFLLVLWSVECAPCYAELAQLGAALRAVPGLPIELVATDAPELRAEVEDTLERYGLAAHASWQFAQDAPERLRFHVDPAWFGELPRSYFYDAAGQRHGYSGALTGEQVQAWLRTLPAPRSPSPGATAGQARSGRCATIQQDGRANAC